MHCTTFSTVHSCSMCFWGVVISLILAYFCYQESNSDYACFFVLLCSERLKNDELLAAKKEEESKVAREKMREEQRRRREAVSEDENLFPMGD